MSMPFYVSPEQVMKDRADYARKGIARGRSLIACSVSDGIVSANMVDTGRTVWAGSVPFGHLVLLVAGPPLVIWLVWLIGAARTNNAGENALKNQTRARELGATEPRTGIIETSSTSTSKRRTREES